MAGIALLGCLDMCGVFAGGPNTVVTGRTETGGVETTVVKTDDIPVSRCCMTDVARLIGHDMGGVLAGRLHAIMTGGTGSRHYFTMIETDLIPGLSRGMATVAFRGGLDMLRMLARLCDTVMTGRALSKCLLPMDKVDDQPGVG